MTMLAEKLKSMLKNYKSIEAQENQDEKFRLMRPEFFTRGSLWVRKTPSKGTYVLTMNGKVTSVLFTVTTNLLGKPNLDSETKTQKEWLNLELNEIEKIVKYYNELT